MLLRLALEQGKHDKVELRLRLDKTQDKAHKAQMRLQLAILQEMHHKDHSLHIVKQDGQIIVKLLETVSADKRGTLLLNLEDYLKESIDAGLVLWLEPFGDRNSLRNLRGIEVKS
jgi:hypothetical protein